MMKKRLLFLLFSLLLTSTLYLTAQGQSGSIVISAADGISTKSMAASAPINSLVVGVLPRIAVEFANHLKTHALKPVPTNLESLLGQINPRIILEFANGVRAHQIIYPNDLIQDGAPPLVTNISTGTGGVIQWQTDEFAVCTLLYGFQPGTYTQTLTGSSFEKMHQFTVSGIEPGTPVYFKIRSTDQSGNVVETGEHTFTITINNPVYIPFVRR